MAESSHMRTKVQILMLRCASQSQNTDLSLALERTGLYKVTHLEVLNHKRSDVFKDTKFSAIIFGCHNFDKRELVTVKNLSEECGHLPVLVLSEQISLFSYRRIGALKNTLAIQKPCDERAIISIVNRMVMGHDFKPTASPRFITDIPVKLVHMKSGLLVPTRMRNYSATGAFLEYKGLSFKVGDTIDIKLETQDKDSFDEAMQMRAKVVWVKEGDQSQATIRGIGVQFIQGAA